MIISSRFCSNDSGLQNVRDLPLKQFYKHASPCRHVLQVALDTFLKLHTFLFDPRSQVKRQIWAKTIGFNDFRSLTINTSCPRSLSKVYDEVSISLYRLPKVHESPEILDAHLRFMVGWKFLLKSKAMKISGKNIMRHIHYNSSYF